MTWLPAPNSPGLWWVRAPGWLDSCVPVVEQGGRLCAITPVFEVGQPCRLFRYPAESFWVPGTEWCGPLEIPTGPEVIR